MAASVASAGGSENDFNFTDTCAIGDLGQISIRLEGDYTIVVGYMGRALAAGLEIAIRGIEPIADGDSAL